MMDSVLNPEAPEFYPHLTSVTQDGYFKVNKTIKSSNNLPTGSSHELFKTFTDFNLVTSQLSENVVSQSNYIFVTELPTFRLKGNDTEYNIEKVIDANDSTLDRVNINIDSVKGDNIPNNNFLAGVKLPPTVSSWNNAPVIAKIKIGSTTFFGAKNIPRPQLTFKDTIDNSDNMWVPKISDKPNNVKPLALNIIYDDNGEAVGYEHPYRVELDLYHPQTQSIDPDPTPPAFPPPLDVTKLTYVDTEALLNDLVEHLTSVIELAVDVEHHSYRTYQGITCLIQISTNEGGDFIIDALVIREHIHKLNVIFTDPKKIKVFHGAESDIIWLQRDFGLYIVGLFDTHQAAKALKLSGLSLKYLLLKYCDVNTDKAYQMADWRMRPLPDELLEYARIDTHYLLYIWRIMKAELLEAGDGKPNLLLSVFEQSRQLCGITYNKEVVHDTSHMQLYLRSKKSFNSQQMAALKLLYKWRDIQARQLDESTTYLVPNHMVLALAERMPREIQGVNACCHPMPPFVKQNLINIHRMVLSCRELPAEPQLYRMPPSIKNMVDTALPSLAAYNVHDLAHFSDYSEEQQINLDLSGHILPYNTHFEPDVKAFQPAYNKKTGAIVSKLNVDAKMFIPPYDRYRKYRSLAQVEEIKEFKDKEAKIAAVGKGNELIKKEVLNKLQDAQIHIVNDDNKNVVQSNFKNEEDDSESKMTAAQRKRKMSTDKVKIKEPPPIDIKKEVDIPNKDNNKNTKNVKPFPYKNVNYKKFHDDVEKDHKQSKNKFKKSK